MNQPVEDAIRLVVGFFTVIVIVLLVIGKALYQSGYGSNW